MFKAVGTHIIVHIDRALQKEKNILSASGLIAAPAYEYMQYNLQYGCIVSVGEKVSNPDITLGRLAIIHHQIEAEEQYLVHTFPNGDQLRWVNTDSSTYNYKLFGVMTYAGDIIPLPQFVFCEPEIQEVAYDYENYFFAGLQGRYASSKMDSGLYVATVPPKEKEKLFIKTRIVRVAPTEDDISVGQVILAQDFTKYPIRLFDKEYWIISREFIISICES